MTHSNRFSIALTTAATAFPVSLPEIKAHLGIGDSDETEDPSLMALLRAVTTSLEIYTRRTFVDTTFTLWMDRFPGKALPWWDGVRQMADTELTDLTESIRIPLPPLDSITHVKAHKQDGSTTTVTASDYIVDTASEPGRVALTVSKTWPTDVLRAINGVEVQFVAGYGPTGSDVPAPIRQAVLMMMGDIRARPDGGDLKFEKVGESSVARFDSSEVSAPVRQMLSAYKIWKF